MYGDQPRDAQMLQQDLGPHEDQHDASGQLGPGLALLSHDAPRLDADGGQHTGDDPDEGDGGADGGR